MASSLEMVDHLFIVCAFFGFLGCTIPLKWHLASWNSGTCIYILWAGLASLNEFVNAVIWRDNAINWAPVWCDISTKFQIGISVGIPAASLCINRRLYRIAAMKVVAQSPKDERKELYIDLGIGIGFPALIMILRHRFDIYELAGCYPSTVISWPSFVIVWCWPVVIGLVSAVFCIMTLRHVHHLRSGLKSLSRNNTNTLACGLNLSRYNRLIALAAVDLLCTVPFGIMGIYLNARNGLLPWVNEANTHYDFSRVEQIPAVIWTSVPELAQNLWLNRWLNVLCAFLFFGLFGFAAEAKKQYSMAYWWIVGMVGIKPKPKVKRNSIGDDQDGLPRFARRNVRVNNQDIDSIGIDLMGTLPRMSHPPPAPDSRTCVDQPETSDSCKGRQSLSFDKLPSCVVDAHDIVFAGYELGAVSVMGDADGIPNRERPVASLTLPSFVFNEEGGSNGDNILPESVEGLPTRVDNSQESLHLPPGLLDVPMSRLNAPLPPLPAHISDTSGMHMAINEVLNELERESERCMV